MEKREREKWKGKKKKNEMIREKEEKWETKKKNEIARGKGKEVKQLVRKKRE